MSSRDDPEFNLITQRWEYEDEDGNYYQQDPNSKIWLPITDDEQFDAQQAADSVPGVGEKAPAKYHPRKRKIQETFTGAEQEGAPVTSKKKQDKPDQKPRATSVYVQGLPLDSTIEEVASVFSKCGLLSEDPVTGQPRIKLYTDANGKQKGDALVIYFREQSVSLAIQMLDDTSLRGNQNLMKVSKASFTHKEGKGDNPARKVLPEAEQKKASRRAGKLKSKLADWSDDEEVAEPLISTKFSKIVILKHMFTLAELEQDKSLLLDLKNDVREECEKLGEVTNVVLYDQEAEGVMSVRFKKEFSAQECIKMMNGRYFAGQQVQAMLYDGKKRYLRTTKHTEDEDGEGEEERLEKFGAWLEGEE